MFTALGAAMGLGNVLRFPGLCYCYGGAFVIAYAVALAAVGYPLLRAELSLGKGRRTPFPAAIKSVNRRAGALGWAACVNSALIAVYYSGIIARLAGKTGTFYAEVNCAPADWQWLTVLFAGVCWLCLGVALAQGANARSRLARISVTVQVCLLAILAARGLIYNNSALALYKIFAVDFSALLNVRTWAEALSQALLSLSVAAGVMPAFANAMPADCSPKSSAARIIAANFAGCVLSSVALLTVAYGCGLADGVGANGLANAFGLYPVALSAAFGGGVFAGAFGTLFFASLTLTAFVSALSLLGALYSPLNGRLPLSPSALAAVLCVACAVLSLPAVASFDNIALADALTCGVFAPVIAFAEGCTFIAARHGGRRSGKISPQAYSKRRSRRKRRRAI